MTSVFIDTSYLLALELANDQNHATALRHWRQTVRNLPRLITSSYVFDEIVTFFNSRGHHAKAIEVANRLMRSPSIHMVHVDESLFRDGWLYLQQYQDKTYSLTDCISFVIMQRFGISVAYTFDQHFVQAKYIKEP